MDCSSTWEAGETYFLLLHGVWLGGYEMELVKMKRLLEQATKRIGDVWEYKISYYGV